MPEEECNRGDDLIHSLVVVKLFGLGLIKTEKKILLKKLLVGQSEALSEDLSSPSSTGSCTCVLYWVMTYCKLRTVQLACTVSVSSNCWSLVWWALPFLLVNETFWFIELPSLFFFFHLTLVFIKSVPNHRPAMGSHCTEHPRTPCSPKQRSMWAY